MLGWVWTALLAGTLFTLAACSGESDKSLLVPYPHANPPLYEITSDGDVIEGWMLGTIHALPEEVEWRTARINQVIDEADLLMVEIASLGQDDEVRKAFFELSRSPDLPALNERVSREIRSHLEAMVERSGVSRTQLQDYEDWAAAIMLSQVDAPGRPEFGVDRALITDFVGREVVGFETAREQLGIFDQLAASDQRTLLEATVRDWATSKGERDRLITAWLSGDISQLKEIGETGIMADPELRAALLTNRNDNWIEPISEALMDDPLPLIAVGTAHLLGPDGLVTRVEAQGYTVRRVR